MRGVVPKMHSLLDEWGSQADFLCVYILEARKLPSFINIYISFVCDRADCFAGDAQDEWPISSARYNNGKPVIYNQPRSMKERLAIANAFVSNYNIRVPVVCDQMDNAFEEAFAPWPFRFYIIEDGKLALKPQPRNCAYDVSEISSWLLNRFTAEE